MLLARLCRLCLASSAIIPARLISLQSVHGRCDPGHCLSNKTIVLPGIAWGQHN